MADFIFTSAYGAFANGDIDFAADDIRILAVDSGYTPDAADDFLSDVGAGARIGDAVALSGKTVSEAGVCDASDTTITSVPSGETIEGFIYYKHTGTEGTSQLIAFYDSWTNLPLSTDGNNVTAQHPSGANGIIKIGPTAE
jgi:hypothetical protein